MKIIGRAIIALVLMALCVGVAAAAPGVPWNYDLWTDEAISPTPEARSVTLENVNTAHVYYDFAAGVTTTAWIVVNEGWNSEELYSQVVTGTTDFDDAVTGAITLTAVYPDVTVYISTTDETGTATVGLWQR